MPVSRRNTLETFLVFHRISTLRVSCAWDGGRITKNLTKKSFAVRTALLLAAASAALAGLFLWLRRFSGRLGCILIGFTGLGLRGASSAALLPASPRGTGRFSRWLGAACTAFGAPSATRGSGKDQPRAGYEGRHADAGKHLLDFFQFHGLPLERTGCSVVGHDSFNPIPPPVASMIHR